MRRKSTGRKVWTRQSIKVSEKVSIITISNQPATIYFVDATNGSDSNNGIDASTAWKTITKVNAETFVAGDLILFKRGETFSGRLNPTDSGIAYNPIVYSAYGSGDRPIIDGSANYALLIENPVCHLRYEHIDFSGSSVTGAHVVRCYAHDMYFYDCIFRDSIGTTYAEGFSAHTTDGYELYNITVDSCEAKNNLNGSGIAITSDTGAGGPHDCVIKNCISHHNGTSLSAHHGIYVRHGCIIEDCLSYNNSSGAYKTNCEGVQDSPYYPIVRNNIGYSCRYGIIVDNIQSLIYNNLIHSCSYTALQIGVDTDDCLIYFNTFSNCTAGNALIEVTGNPDGAIIKNNIFIQDHSVYDKGFLATVGALTLEAVISQNTFDYNTYFHNVLGDGHGFNDGSGNHVFSVWQGLGADTNSTLLVVDPDFVARYTDYHPSDGGNLKAHGIAITGYEIDQDGHTRADPPTPGCYEGDES